MHKQSFEEQMQQLMQGFNEQPEEFVWENIEQAINKKEKKRRFIFWWILPVCLTGIGFAIFFNNKNNTGINSIAHHTNTSTKTSETISKQPNDNNLQSNIANKKIENISETTIKQNDKTKNIKQIAQKNTSTTIYPEIRKVTSVTEIKKESSLKTTTDKRNTINIDEPKQTNVSNEINVITETDKSKAEITTDTTSKKNIIEVDSTIIANNDKKKTSAKNKWKIGATVGYGFMHEKVKSATYTSYENGFSNSGSTAGQGPVQIINSYTVSAAASYNIGIAATKPFAKNYSVETGISYNYMRSQYNTTSLNTSSFNSYNSKTINKYHALEIPVMLERNLINKNNIGVGLRAGINNSIILNANSITNNQSSKIENINTYQASIGYGLKFNFKINKTNVFILPSLQHSITNLTANSRHKWTRGTVNIGFNFK